MSTVAVEWSKENSGFGWGSNEHAKAFFIYFIKIWFMNGSLLNELKDLAECVKEEVEKEKAQSGE